MPDKKFSAIRRPIKKIKDPNTFTRNYNAATGVTHEMMLVGNQSVTPGYDPKKADQYKANAIKKYGSLEASREAYASPPPRAGGPSRGPQMKYNAAPQMGHSPLEGHCMGSAAKMESNKQEKYNLLHDNPVAKHGSWMSKHSKSAFQMGHSPAEMGHSPAERGHSPLEKKVKVNYKGKELTLDDRSPEYKHIMKAKEGNKQVATKVVMDKSGTSYTGFKKA